MSQKPKKNTENVNNSNTQILNSKSAFKISVRILLVILIVVTALRMLFNLFPCYKIDMGGV